MSKFSVRLLVGSVGFVAIAALGGGMMCGPFSASPVSGTGRVLSLPGSGQGVQVADEVIRELRRLGLNFAHDRIERPYDPKGEIC